MIPKVIAVGDELMEEISVQLLGGGRVGFSELYFINHLPQNHVPLHHSASSGCTGVMPSTAPSRLSRHTGRRERPVYCGNRKQRHNVISGLLES